MIGANGPAQMDAMLRFLGESALLSSDSSVPDFLFKPPLEDISVSGLNYEATFGFRFTLDGDSLADAIAIPTQFLPEEQVVLGSMYAKKGHLLLADDCAPVPGMLVAKDLRSRERGAASDCVSRFAFHLPSARLLETEENVSGEVVLLDYQLRSEGFQRVRCAVLVPSGDAAAFEITMRCPFCTSRERYKSATDRCSCSVTLADRMAGAPLSFSRWDQVIDFGRLQTLPTSEYTMGAIDGYPSPLQNPIRSMFSLLFPGDRLIPELVGGYLNYVSCKLVSVERSLSMPETELSIKCRETLQIEAIDKIRITSEERQMKKHTRSFRCYFCNASFNKVGNRNRHVAVVHGETKKHQCQICGLRLTQESNLKRHITQKHEEHGKFACSFCSTEVTTKANLLRHIRNKHPHMQTQAPTSFEPRPKHV